MVPPPSSKVIARVSARSKSASKRNIPLVPPNVLSTPSVILPDVAPRSLSLSTTRAPSLISVPPLYVLSSLEAIVKEPVPFLTTCPVPVMALPV